MSGEAQDGDLATQSIALGGLGPDSRLSQRVPNRLGGRSAGVRFPGTRGCNQLPFGLGEQHRTSDPVTQPVHHPLGTLAQKRLTQPVLEGHNLPERPALTGQAGLGDRGDEARPGHGIGYHQDRKGKRLGGGPHGGWHGRRPADQDQRGATVTGEPGDSVSA